MINISPIKGKGKVITTEYKESEFYVLPGTRNMDKGWDAATAALCRAGSVVLHLLIRRLI